MTTQTRTVVVFVPKPASRIESVVDPESAVVGFEDEWFDGHSNIDVHYEGNRYGAVNMKTFADRVHHAASRMRERYPTTAKSMVPKSDLILVGYWQDDHVVPGKTSDLADIGLWLALPSNDLAHELKRSL